MSLTLAARLQRPRPVAFAVSLVLAWLLLALIAFALRRGPIADDLAARATRAVHAAGGVHAEVSVEGREAVVNGRFPNAAAAEQARVSAAVSGTTSARLGDDVIIASEPARPLVLGVADGGLSISATVPDRESRATLLAAVADATTGKVTGDVRIDAKAAMPPIESVTALAGALRSVAGTHRASVDGTTVAVSGAAPDDAARARLGARVLAAATSTVAGATLDNRLVIAPSRPATGANPTTGAAPATGAGPSAGDAPTAPQEARTLAALRAALRGQAFTFGPDTTVLSARTRGGLDRVAAALRDGDLPVLVGGYTDASGPSALNQALSLGRAQAAADYLADQGVPADLLRAAGFGARQPMADNSTPRGRAANRRVEITPLSAGASAD